ncbi:MAG: YidC/Oxa1 family membrane protein insertase [Dehalococcoidia bacterium]
MDLIHFIFDTFLIDPLTNIFVFFTAITGNAGLAVILLTIFIRLVTFPLNMKQMKTTRLMAALSPLLQDVQKRYSDPRRRSEEQMKLYREFGVSPLGCLSSSLIQMPILFALYRTFSTAIGESPEAVIQLSARLYDIDFIRSSMPLPAHFLWLNLGRPDPFIIPLLVGASTYVLQKMTMMPALTEQQRAQNSMMNLMMPFIFVIITLSLPSGLGLYYVLSNLIGMIMQYLYIGRGPFNWRGLLGLNQEPILPRALEVRQSVIDRVAASRASQEVIEGESAPGADSAAARRRRRYSSGKRRGRGKNS